MSRIGKKTIEIPKGIEVFINGQEVRVKGLKGELKYVLPDVLLVEKQDNILKISPKKETKKTNVLWGTARAIINNMILGVEKGFQKKLEIEGIGFKAVLEGRTLVLSLGFSHPVKFELPEGINAVVEKNSITISGIDKYLVGQTAANIRALKKPEPYKGKGIRYEGEVIRRKAGKKAVSATK